MPPGVYAVAPDDAGGEAQPGVIFCLRQRNAGDVDARQRPPARCIPSTWCTCTTTAESATAAATRGRRWPCSRPQRGRPNGGHHRTLRPL